MKRDPDGQADTRKRADRAIIRSISMQFPHRRQSIFAGSAALAAIAAGASLVAASLIRD